MLGAELTSHNSDEAGATETRPCEQNHLDSTNVFSVNEMSWVQVSVLLCLRLGSSFQSMSLLPFDPQSPQLLNKDKIPGDIPTSHNGRNINNNVDSVNNYMVIANIY